jgi:phenylpropionate dioxygenase-like ring-hydroxylating dioxygenase large terminal subunit
MQATELREVIARQRPGWSLEQPFYTSAAIYEFEQRGWLAEQWYVLGHCSEVPKVGSFIVRNLLGESLIIVRDTTGVLRGFYNVCRHRGSRICDRDGQATHFVCPYHAWSYRLDGSVRLAPAMSEDIDLGRLGLHAVPVREIGGVIVGSLKGDPQTLDTVQRETEPMLRYHGIPQARIAARRSYPTGGNWKLVMENFAECYHCFPAHPEYCSVMQHVGVVAREATPEAAAAWQQEEERWVREEADPNSPVKNLWRPDLESPRYGVSRSLIGGGRKTQSQNGQPVAPLMGQQRRFDGGVGGFNIRPFCIVGMANDHAAMFQFLPTGPEKTDVIITWLVDGSAKESEVDVERMIWMWDETTVQDKTIIERNAEGVRSLSYVPGPYSAKLEPGADGLVRHYLHELSARCSGALA